MPTSTKNVPIIDKSREEILNVIIAFALIQMNSGSRPDVMGFLRLFVYYTEADIKWSDSRIGIY
jgi:hypothetical protein